MQTIATLLSGGEGVGVGAKAAGLSHLWGIEITDERNRNRGKMRKSLQDIGENAIANQHKYPTLRTLLAEISELAYALDGEHEHPPEYELIQIGGIVVNWLDRIYRAKNVPID